MSKKALYYWGIICCLSIVLTACNTTAVVQVWENSSSENFNFAEKALDPPPPLTGVCFSGGGTRAMTCAIGQMKGLDSLDLWDDIGYVSAVSGGSWASAIFTYYNAGAANDHELLGTPRRQKDLTMAELRKMSKSFMGYTPTRNLTEALGEDLLKELLSLGLLERPDDIWIHAVGHTYFKPFGLYDHKSKNKYFTYDEKSRDSIIARNPKLKKNEFIMVHNQPGDIKRPYLVVNASVLGPADLLPLEKPESLAVFNYTPLYLGTANGMTINYNSRNAGKSRHKIGGGFIEPFAFGSNAPKKKLSNSPGISSLAKVKLNERRRYSIVDASGTSSSAVAATFADQSDLLQLLSEFILGFTLDDADPKEKYWPVQSEEIVPAENYRFGDGGSLENLGLLSLLQRGVSKAVVFINTDTKLDVNFTPGKNNPPNKNVVSSDVYPLFGYPEGNMINNTVFTHKDFATVFHGLKVAKKANKTVMTKTTLEVQPNKWWGIKGGNEVEILWVYNDKVMNWESKLPAEVKAEIAKGKNGDFRDFPSYKLFFEDDTGVQQLTPAQVNLLYQLSAWNVYDKTNAKLYDFLKGN